MKAKLIDAIHKGFEPEKDPNDSKRLAVETIADLEVFEFEGTIDTVAPLVIEGLMNDMCTFINKGRRQVGMAMQDWIPKLVVKGDHPAGSIVLQFQDEIKERCRCKEIDYEIVI